MSTLRSLPWDRIGPLEASYACQLCRQLDKSKERQGRARDGGKYPKSTRRQLLALMWHCLLKYRAHSTDLNEIARKHLQAVYWLHCTTLLRKHFSLFCSRFVVFLFLFFLLILISSGRARADWQRLQRGRVLVLYMRTERGLGSIQAAIICSLCIV